MRVTRVFLICLALIVAASAVFAAPVVKAKPPVDKPGKQAPPSGESPDWWGTNPNKPQTNFKGIVDSVSPTSITVKSKEAAKTFAVTQETKVVVQGQKATINDVKPGNPVGVRFKQDGNTLVAVGIVVAKPGTGGEITAVQGNTITLREKNGAVHQVAVTDKTKYRSHGYIGTLADLRIGYRVMAQGTMSNDVLTADSIEFVPSLARGTVIARNGDLITVKAVKQQEIQLLGTPATAVLIRPRVADNKKGTLADVQVGAPVNVGFAPNPNGPAQLLWIDVLTGQ